MADTLLAVADLTVRYRNGALGVQGVSFEVRKGQIVAILGAAGAGKTTTVRGISGFLRSEGARVIQGDVTFRGKNITNQEPHNVSRLGLFAVPERRKIFANLSVQENLEALGKGMVTGDRRAEVEALIFDLFPVLGEVKKKLAGRLSGGQQQMLAIGRALMVDPKLLIIDEMTLGLHPSLHEPLFEAVQRIASTGSAVLLVDESTGNTLEVAQHCVLLKAGQVWAAGPSSDFIGNELLVAGYVGE
ncbi:branched-chain amino acid transport system ATP-binding protein [Asanoa ferruginea]|uniref:Branched-chain amino acid transport system ATP-binding protein n=1 Tax=Asanoa ferruginea TaxID=53367 RepID=A0A3D9ZLS0_9ACTN|nr:ATP-binding cassette domain-containing protein [Asanoa ferruginea]REF98336.1 branched-chain amino acid transport system ATP-binding protein [Asanoa ferruginea]GIF52775.1 ABC transporter ATP-binding protein [Asanoa ferruginea]